MQRSSLHHIPGKGVAATIMKHWKASIYARHKHPELQSPIVHLASHMDMTTQHAYLMQPQAD